VENKGFVKMKTDLEAGYLMQLFNEPIYLVGYEASVIENPVEVKKDQEVRKEEVNVTSQPEIIKTIPVTPKLQAVSQKVHKKCILLFTSSENELSEKELAFLSKVMGAAKVQQGEYECINFEGITINDIASRYAFDKLVLFGATIPNLSIGQYQCTQVKSTKIISADAVWMIEANTTLKKQLWDQLQIMFGL
jgi:DNA polymerase III psi subunit